MNDGVIFPPLFPSPYVLVLVVNVYGGEVAKIMEVKNVHFKILKIILAYPTSHLKEIS